ncbi:MAG: hypothetical protein H6701_09065 [Myxococcales bacterium]|nr:hypothetical protein [Myxococcales bacterium]
MDDPEGLLPEDGSAGRGEVDEDLFEDSPAVSPGVTPVEGAPASVG